MAVATHDPSTIHLGNNTGCLIVYTNATGRTSYLDVADGEVPRAPVYAAFEPVLIDLVQERYRISLLSTEHPLHIIQGVVALDAILLLDKAQHGLSNRSHLTSSKTLHGSDTSPTSLSLSNK